MKKYQVIYADPPWRYQRTNIRGCADNHYPTMELDDICALPVRELADKDCILFLWANIVAILRSLAHDDGYTVIIVTHDHAVAEKADVILQMKDGAWI